MGGKLELAGKIVRPPNTEETQKTFVVLGVPRGGTSMAAGCLRICGINLGDNLDLASNEDRDFVAHSAQKIDFSRLPRSLSRWQAKRKFIKSLRAHIADKNQKNDIWGWKDPIVAAYLRNILPSLRNPHFVFITRDPAACAMRELLVHHPYELEDDSSPNFLPHMAQKLSLYQRSISILSKSKHPIMMASYERALRYPEQFAATFLEFIGLDEAAVDYQSKREKMISYIKPDRISGDIYAQI